MPRDVMAVSASPADPERFESELRREVYGLVEAASSQQVAVALVRLLQRRTEHAMQVSVDAMCRQLGFLGGKEAPSQFSLVDDAGSDSGRHWGRRRRRHGPSDSFWRVPYPGTLLPPTDSATGSRAALFAAAATLRTPLHDTEEGGEGTASSMSSITKAVDSPKADTTPPVATMNSPLGLLKEAGEKEKGVEGGTEMTMSTNAAPFTEERWPLANVIDQWAQKTSAELGMQLQHLLLKQQGAAAQHFGAGAVKRLNQLTMRASREELEGIRRLLHSVGVLSETPNAPPLPLDPEMMSSVFQFLPLYSIFSCLSRISRSWFSATNDPRYWQRIGQLCLQRLPPPGQLAVLLLKLQSLRHLTLGPSLEPSLFKHFATARGSFLQQQPLKALDTLLLSGCVKLDNEAIVLLARGRERGRHRECGRDTKRLKTKSEHHSPPRHRRHHHRHHRHHGHHGQRRRPWLSGLRTLHLAGCRLVGDEGLGAIFRNLTGLTELNFAELTLVTPAVLEHLHHLPGLVTLNLSQCPHIDDTAVRWVSEGCPQLLNLRLAECWKLTTLALQHLSADCTSLETLDLGRCYRAVNQASIQTLCEGCPRLTGLVLADCPLPDESLTALSRLAFLNTLDLSGSIDICDQGLSQLAQGCPLLTNVCLRGCVGLQDAAIACLAQCCKNLESLNLTRTVVSDQALRSLGTWALHLRVLDLTNCAHITCKGIHALIRCHRLEELIMKQMPGITDPAMGALALLSNLTCLDLSGGAGITNQGLRFFLMAPGRPSLSLIHI